MAVKIGIVANKGGTNKSSVALCLADAMIHCNYKVLLVDADQQCNATSVYDAEIEGVNTMADVLAGECSAKDAVQHTEMGDIIAGDFELAGLETRLNNEINRYELLSDALKDVDKDYDFIIIDTPPALGVYTLNAIIASDGVIVPIKADKFAVDGLIIRISAFIIRRGAVECDVDCPVRRECRYQHQRDQQRRKKYAESSFHGLITPVDDIFHN